MGYYQRPAKRMKISRRRVAPAGNMNVSLRQMQGPATHSVGFWQWKLATFSFPASTENVVFDIPQTEEIKVFEAFNSTLSAYRVNFLAGDDERLAVFDIVNSKTNPKRQIFRIKGSEHCNKVQFSRNNNDIQEWTNAHLVYIWTYSFTPSDN